MVETSVNAPGSAPAKRADPIPESERIHTMDVLRGIALLGILVINVSAFVLPIDWFRVDWDNIGPVEYAVEIGKRFFAEGKFYTLFALLFGMGFAVQLGRAEQKGVGFAARYLWRTILLFAIGVFHLIVIWDGDILTAYAICGLVLLLLYGLKRALNWLVRKLSRKGRTKAPTWLSLIGAFILIYGLIGASAGFSVYAYQTKQAAEAGQSLSGFQKQIMKQLKRAKDPEKVAERERKKAEENQIFASGSYPDVVAYRVDHLGQRLFLGPFWLTLVGIFLIGAYIGRRGFIARAEQLKRGFKWLTAISLTIGIPASVVFVWLSMVTQDEVVPWWQVPHWAAKTTAGLTLALALIGGVTLLMTSGARRWLMHLAPVGRMALSNYLLQSVISTTVIYGYGGGLVLRLNAVEQMLYVTVLFAFQIVISRWWLQRYRFGPVEWLWRSLAYFRRQPMRRSESPAEPAASSPIES